MKSFPKVSLVVIILFGFGTAFAGDTTKTAVKTLQPDADNGGLKLPAGFGAITVVDSLGRNRHLVVNSNGNIYVKLARLKDGKGILVLREDANGKGKVVKSFGRFGGTGIAIKNGYVYASSDTSVFRFKLNNNGEIANPDAPEMIVTNLLSKRQHETKSIALDNAGNVYVNIGAPSNS